MKAYLEPKGFKQVIIPRCKEVVYDYVMPNFPNCAIRLYTSISVMDGMSRDVGGDAIRCILFNIKLNKAISTSFRVYRTKGWELRISEKGKLLIEQYKKAIHYTNNI
jgi:hypothetical protein